MMQLSEMNALIAETVKEIDALEEKFIADLDRLPEAIPIEEVEKRMNEMTVAMWSKWRGSPGRQAQGSDRRNPRSAR